MTQITTYATLQTAVAELDHRSDSAYTAMIPLFIQMLEAELNDELILRDMETEATVSTVQGQNYASLPIGFVSPIAMWIIESGSERTALNLCRPEELQYSPTNGIPQDWAIDGEYVRFDCPADAVYSCPFRYVKSSNLSNSNTTNYLLLKRPDVYLYGALVQSALWRKSPQDVATWGAFLRLAKAGVKAAESRAKGLVPLRTEIAKRMHSNILQGD